MPFWKKYGETNILKYGETADQLESIINSPSQKCNTIVIITSNDVLNKKGDAEKLKRTFPRRVLLLPRGGHLGYINEDHWKEHLEYFFDKNKLLDVTAELYR